MPIKDQVKNFAKKLVEHHPDAATLRALVRARKPAELHFRDDGIIPNNPKFPVLLYRAAVNLKNRRFPLMSSSTRCSMRMAGVGRGATPCTTSFIIIRKFTK